jgi:hypothetical protein
MRRPPLRASTWPRARPRTSIAVSTGSRTHARNSTSPDLAEQRGGRKKLISVYTMEALSGEKEPLRAHAETGRQVFTENANEIAGLEG